MTNSTEPTGSTEPTEFAKPTGGAGNWFRPDQHTNDLALLIEAKSVARNVRNEYQGQVTYRDEVTADITIFATSESLDKREPSAVLKGALITHAVLVKDAEANLDRPMLAVVRKVKTYFVFQEVPSADVVNAVGEYYQGRETQVAAAVAAAPSFD